MTLDFDGSMTDLRHLEMRLQSSFPCDYHTNAAARYPGYAKALTFFAFLEIPRRRYRPSLTSRSNFRTLLLDQRPEPQQQQHTRARLPPASAVDCFHISSSRSDRAVGSDRGIAGTSLVHKGYKHYNLRWRQCHHASRHT